MDEFIEAALQEAKKSSAQELISVVNKLSITQLHLTRV